MLNKTRLEPIETLFAPTIHLNGTSKEALLADLLGAINAIVAAKEALRKTHPHGRDYYVQPVDPTQLAIRQFGRREAALEAVREELTLIAMAVQDQGK